MDDEPVNYCVDCGAPLEPGNWYKCDSCLEAELGILDHDYAPPGQEDTFDDYEPNIDKRWVSEDEDEDE